jgi:MFS family permease
VTVVVIRIVGRQIPDRLGSKRASGTSLALLATGLATIGLWNEPAGLFIGTVVFAAGQALAFPALLTLAVSGTPAAERSSVVGTFTACADVGFALGALTLGGVAAVAGYESVFVVGALASVVGAFLLARTPAQTQLAAAEAS